MSYRITRSESSPTKNKGMKSSFNEEFTEI